MLKPIDSAQWNSTTAAHLINRAGFGGPPREIAKLVTLGPEKAVASLIDYEKIPDSTPAPAWAKPDPERAQRYAALRKKGSEMERREAQKEEQRLQREHLLELRGWWINRM
ncbi:MAG: DUF1800 family protein, partial [Verrucomicrobiota bacterium]